MRITRNKSALPCDGGTRRGRALWQLATLACVGLVANPALAGRPLVTDDARVMGPRQCEIESFGARRQGSGSTYLSGQLGCGIDFQTQLAFGSAGETGARNALFGLSGKTSLLEVAEQRAGVAIAYALVWQKNLHDTMRRQSAEVKAVLTVPLDDYLLHANTGWIGAHPAHAGRMTWNAAVEKTHVFGRVDLMMEVFGDSRTTPSMQLGSRWTAVPGRLFVDGSWGRRIHARKEHIATLGIRIAF